MENLGATFQITVFSVLVWGLSDCAGKPDTNSSDICNKDKNVRAAWIGQNYFQTNVDETKILTCDNRTSQMVRRLKRERVYYRLLRTVRKALVVLKRRVVRADRKIKIRVQSRIQSEGDRMKNAKYYEEKRLEIEKYKKIFAEEEKEKQLKKKMLAQKQQDKKKQLEEEVKKMIISKKEAIDKAREEAEKLVQREKEMHELRTRKMIGPNQTNVEQKEVYLKEKETVKTVSETTGTPEVKTESEEGKREAVEQTTKDEKEKYEKQRTEKKGDTEEAEKEEKSTKKPVRKRKVAKKKVEKDSEERIKAKKTPKEKKSKKTPKEKKAKKTIRRKKLKSKKTKKTDKDKTKNETKSN